MVESNSYRILADKLYEHCLEVELENERLVYRANKIKKELQRRGRDIELLKRRLDRYNDNWRSLPMVLPHPKRKIEQKRGPKPKTKLSNASMSHACADAQQTFAQNNTGSMDKLKKVRQKRGRKTDKDTAMRQQEASLQRQKQQQQRQELQKQRQREQQAIKLAAQQQRQLMRQQKQLAAQQAKQQRQLQRQQQRFSVQQQKQKQPTTHIVGSMSPNVGLKSQLMQATAPRINPKMSTTFLTPQRNPNTGCLTYSIIGDNIMPPPPPPRKMDSTSEQPQPTQILLMHRPLQVTAVKNRQKIK